MALTELGDRLALIIDARTDGAVSNIRKLTVAEKAAADQAEVLKARIADLEARAVRNPASASTGLQLSKARNELAGLESSLASGVTPAAGRAEQALSKLGLAGTVSGSALVEGFETAGVAAAAFGGFELIKHGVEEYVALAQAVRQFQQASGASAEDASKLVGISSALGVSSSAAALGVFRLGKQVALAPQNFAQYGIAIAKNNDGSTDLVGTLENVATAYQRNGDAAQRNAIVYQAFGRAGTTLLPLLNATKDTYEELTAQEQKRGHILDQKDVDQAYKFQIATRELKDSLNALALDAAKTVVPALTAVGTTVTAVTDRFDQIAHSGVGRDIFGVLKYANIVTGPLAVANKIGGLFGVHPFGGGQSAEAKAVDEQQQADALAVQQQQAQVAQQVLSTLASPFDALAGPAAVKAAHQTLSGALSAVKDAKREQSAALRELAKAREGSPVATESSLTAAEARVRAAEASLRKARYVGGDAGVKSAQASVLSAQASLNRLRQQGGTDTNTLATAEDRLHRANEAVTKAQQAAAKAQKAQNDAHGLTAAEVLKRIAGQAQSQTVLAESNVKLAKAGVSSAVIVSLDQLNSQIPGTLKRTADSINKGLVDGLNHQQNKIDAAHLLFGDAASQADAFYKAGKNGRKSFDSGFFSSVDSARVGGHHRAAKDPISVLTQHPVPDLSNLPIQIGTLNIRTDRGSELQRAIRKEARHRQLSGGGLRGPQ